jgi:hypothetical protein
MPDGVPTIMGCRSPGAGCLRTLHLMHKLTCGCSWALPKIPFNNEYAPAYDHGYLVAVIHHHTVACLQQLLHHAAPHAAQTDPTNLQTSQIAPVSCIFHRTSANRCVAVQDGKVLMLFAGICPACFTVPPGSMHSQARVI